MVSGHSSVAASAVPFVPGIGACIVSATLIEIFCSNCCGTG